jgi:PAS domain S-box-containing protein
MLNAERVEQELAERAKELNCLYGISELLEHENVSLDESLQGIVNLIPPAWQYPEITCAKIILDDREFTTENYAEPVTKQSAHIIVHGGISGALEVGYLERRPDIDGGPFLKEERLLIKAIAERLGRIIERIRSEEALRKQKEFTETALDSQRDTFFVFEPATGRAISWNQAFRGITRYTDEEIAGMRAPDSYYGPEDLERARICMQDVLEKGRCTIELELICKDGQRLPTEYEASLVKDVAGAPRYVIAVGRDIRERKKAERDREAIIAKLEQALAEVKRLSGFLPICASCKKIRDDKGYWQQIERYITDHSEALFSHSICPDCARKLYPDLFTDDSTRHPGDPK